MGSGRRTHQSDCEWCGSGFESARKRRFCSPKCRWTAKNERSAGRSGVRPELRARRCSACGIRFTPTEMGARQTRCPDCRAAGWVKAEICEPCGEIFLTRNTASRFCSLACFGASKVPNRAPKDHIRRAKYYGVPWERVDRMSVFRRDRWLCGICGDSIDRDLAWPHPQSASLDHVIPISRGGPHLLSNVQAAHLFCNISKRDGRSEVVADAA